MPSANPGGVNAKLRVRNFEAIGTGRLPYLSEFLPGGQTISDLGPDPCHSPCAGSRLNSRQGSHMDEIPLRSFPERGSAVVRSHQNEASTYKGSERGFWTENLRRFFRFEGSIPVSDRCWRRSHFISVLDGREVLLGAVRTGPLHIRAQNGIIWQNIFISLVATVCNSRKPSETSARYFGDRQPSATL